MLKFDCPSCGKILSISKPKTGKYSPTCSGCQQKFLLAIQQRPDGKFTHRTGLPAAKTQVAPAPSPKRPANKTKINAAALDARNAHRTETKTPEPVRKPGQQAALEATAKVEAGSVGQRTRAARTGGVTAADAGDGPFTVAHPDQAAQSMQNPFPSGRLGPYQLIRPLGQGGMGLVFLAKQTSLDRNVALKVVRSQLASSPSMMARFTREAYAAAQLVHPNVVQIYDMGDAHGSCYFSMELVDGASLHELVGGKRKLDPEQATSFILHAARGLQCAHNAGMVHRDIKPANLLVTKEGVVKVADLGLVKVAGKIEIEDDVEEAVALSASPNITRVGATVGTSYYMAPEQAKSAINVDHRSDIYSLGCTYYVLLTGRRPFEGRSVEELVSKHSTAPIVAPSTISARVPKELSAIVVKMMAKDPDDRYQTAHELIIDLEKQLGICTGDVFTPDEDDASALESAAKGFNQVTLAKLRSMVIPAVAAGSLLLAFLMMFLDWRWATGFLVLPLTAAASYFLIGGIVDRAALFAQTRAVVLGMGIPGWLKAAAAAVMSIVVAVLAGTILHWLVLGLLGIGLGLGAYLLLDLRVKALRAGHLADADKLLRKMRVKGLDEMSIQKFVAKYAGDHWEEFFENLFGYDAKRRVRDEVAKSEIGKTKPRFRGWRDSIYDNLSKRIDARSKHKERRHLSKLEQLSLEAQGIPTDQAKLQASQMAAAIVDHGQAIRAAAVTTDEIRDPDAIRQKQRDKIKAMLAEAKSGQYYTPPTTGEKVGRFFDMALGSFPRFLLGCCLIIGCLLWARQNELFTSPEELTNIVSSADAEAAAHLAKEKLTALSQKETSPLDFPVAGQLFYNVNPLIAGLILLLSTVVTGWRMALFVIPAAIVTLFGATFGIPTIQTFTPMVHILSGAIGIALFAAGVLLARSSAP